MYPETNDELNHLLSVLKEKQLEIDKKRSWLFDLTCRASSVKASKVYYDNPEGIIAIRNLIHDLDEALR